MKKEIYIWEYFNNVPYIQIFEHILGEPSENDLLLYTISKSELKNMCFGC